MLVKIVDYRNHPMTSSSSSHSVVVLKSGTRVDGVKPDDEFQYAWDEFVLADPAAKVDYLFTASAGMGVADLPIASEASVGSNTLPITSDDAAYEVTVGYNDDSRSVPMRAVLYALCTDFAPDPRKVIVGGNDNSTNRRLKSMTLERGRHVSYLWRFEVPEMRKEHIGVKRTADGVVLFSRSTGKRVAFVFEGLEWKRSEKAASPAVSPSLLDISVTDFCKKGCPMCYRGCTAAGKHADFSYIQNLAAYVKARGIWEVVIGGGEPIEYPHLADAINAFHEAGARVSVTTGIPADTLDMWWDEGPWDHADGRVYPGVGGFDSLKPDSYAVDIISADDIGGFRGDASVYYHMIAGVTTEKQAAEVFAELGQKAVLLGYKTPPGRDPDDRPPFSYSEFFKLLEGYKTNGLFHVDRKAYEDMTPAERARVAFAPVPEGSMSMYVDCVAGTVSRSSYAGKPMPASSFADFDAAFAGFAREAWDEE